MDPYLVKKRSNAGVGQPKINKSKKSVETAPSACDNAYFVNLLSISSNTVSHASIIL